MKTINVVAAVIVFKGKFLCVQRGPHKFEYISHKYEFPGGKVEPDESQQEALIREIREELHKEIQIGKKLITVDHQYPDFRILMHSYLCSTDDDKIQLTEHIDYKWLPKSEMHQLDWAAADIPIVKTLLEIHAQDTLS